MNWEQRPLKDIGQWFGGGTPSKSRPEFWDNGSIPWLSPKDMGPPILAGTKDHITPAAVAGSSVRPVPANSVAIVVRSGILERTLPVAMVPFETTLNQDMKAVTPNHDVDARWIAWGLRAFESQLLRTTRKTGTTVASIEVPRLYTFELPVPPLAEQGRILEIIEDHLSRLDAAADYAAAASKRLSGLRNQLVRDAITGRKIAGDRQEAILSDAGTNDGALPMLPSGWMWRRLEDVADVVGGITKDSKKQSDPAFIEVPYLRVANVQRGSLRLDDVTTIRVAPAKAEALRLRPGDVLLNEGGDRDKLARGWVWQGEIENCIHQNHVFRARTRDGLDPYFLSWTANTIGGRWAERNGKQSVNLASISLSMIRKMPVIVPPRAAASHIIQQLHEQLTSVDQTSKQIKAAQVRGSALRRAVLTAAFTGRLTGRHTDQEVVEELADIPSSYSETMVTA